MEKVQFDWFEELKKEEPEPVAQEEEAIDDSDDPF